MIPHIFRQKRSATVGDESQMKTSLSVMIWDLDIGPKTIKKPTLTIIANTILDPLVHFYCIA